MKRAKFLNLFVTSVLLVTVAAGCKKTPKNITPITNPNLRPPGSEGPANALGTANFGNQIPPGSGIRDLNPGASPGDIATPMTDANEDRAALADETIHFDFDRSAIKTSEQPKLDQVATFLKNTPGVQLKIEGNCDERGTEGYNTSLGERRAISARDYLIQKHGIPSDRITTVSWGESKPVDLGKTEEAYAKNRRDDFVILRPNK
jgi:peptidoglycan-associated lipoprotein